MNKIQKQRAVRAFILAPIVAPLTAWIFYAASGQFPSLKDSLEYLVIFFLYGTTLGWVVAIVVGLPCCFFLRRLGKFSLLSIACIGGLAGWGVSIICSLENKPLETITLGILPGICSSIAWWWFAKDSNREEAQGEIER